MSAGPVVEDGVRCMLMRGGTSKGAYFLAEDLPRLELAGDDLLLEHERDLVGLRALERRHSRA